MNSAVFVQTVRECAPPLEVLRKEGLSKKEALDFQKRNFAPKLDNSEVIQHQDPILDLLNNYDVSSLEVGMVSFVSPARLTALGTIVGNVEADLW
jgi:hypothetical protein